MASASKPVKPNDPRVQQFCSITGAPTKDAIKFIQKYKRADVAIDAFYGDPNAIAAASQAKNKSQQAAQNAAIKINELFDKYKEQDSETIGVDGTMAFCADLQVDPEDVVLLAIAYELKSPGIGQWDRKPWGEGWRSLNCDSIPSMRQASNNLRERLGTDSAYFLKVYNYTFDFAKSEGQRSLAIEIACAFWGLLLPHGLQGGALSHQLPEDEGGDQLMADGGEIGWRPEYNQVWFDFLNEKGGKGVSKDTWMMVGVTSQLAL